MARAITNPAADEARLWASAICISVLLNAALLAWISIEALRLKEEAPQALPAIAPQQTIVILPEMFEKVPDEPTPPAAPEVVRTSPDQASETPPASRRFIGERNTQATSDRAPDANAPNLPSQSGREPTRPDELETTETQYQDGQLNRKPAPPTPPTTQPNPPAKVTPPAPPTPPAQIAKGEKTNNPGDFMKSETATREELLEGPHPFEIPIPETNLANLPRPEIEQNAREGSEDGKKTPKTTQEKPRELPKQPQPPIDDPAFAGNQSKTAIRGNISRSGRSALDVADSPMGRYQSKISRAVELAWQRNCVKHRDFITPGYLTVRFFVQADGSVRSVEFVGDLQTGEVQKGFTLSSIRTASIPKMPPAVKKEMGGDALELIFNFYF